MVLHLPDRTTGNGPSSTLFTLPAEVRINIFRHLLSASPKVWTEAMTKRVISSSSTSPSSPLSSPRYHYPPHPATSLLNLAYTCKKLYHEAISHLYAQLNFQLLVHPSGSYAFAPAIQLNNRSKTPRQLRVGHEPSAFPVGLCEQALSATKHVTVVVGPLPADLSASRKAALERLFERFSAMLKETRLRNLSVKYTLSRHAKRGSQNGHRSVDPESALSTQTRSTPGSQSSANLSLLEPARSNSWGVQSSGDKGIVSSPTALRESHGGALLETRFEQVLVSKLNPLLMRVKENDGHVYIGEVDAVFAWEWAWTERSEDSRANTSQRADSGNRADPRSSSTGGENMAERRSSNSSSRSQNVRSTRTGQSMQTTAEVNALTLRLRQPIESAVRSTGGLRRPSGGVRASETRSVSETRPSVETRRAALPTRVGAAGGAEDPGRRRLALRGNPNGMSRRRGGAMLFPDVPL